MARAKTEAFDAATVRTARWAKALSHPVRIRILEILGGRRGCICGGLVELLPLAQSTVSQHLGELREAGLVQGDVDGPRMCYCVDPAALVEAGAAFAGLFRRLGAGCRGPAGARPRARRSAPQSAPPATKRASKERNTDTRRKA